MVDAKFLWVKTGFPTKRMVPKSVIHRIVLDGRGLDQKQHRDKRLDWVRSIRRGIITRGIITRAIITRGNTKSNTTTTG